jgi:hypothetical protein
MRRHIIRWPVECIDGQIPTSNDGPRPEVHRVKNSGGVDIRVVLAFPSN